jgi:voltage-gated potassium channel
MMKEENTRKTWPEVRQSLFRMVSVGIVDIPINQAYDVISTAALLVNLVASIANTFQSVHILYGPVLEMIEAVTVAFFAIDYVL